MKKLIPVIGSAAFVVANSVVSASAGDWGWRGGPGHGAPAPEIGASAIGMLLAGGIVTFIVRRRRQ